MKPEFMLQTQNVSRDYVIQRRWWGAPVRTIHAVKAVSLSMQAGTTTALVGESGSGKSTLGRCIACLDQPTSGHISVAGFDTNALHGANVKAFRRTVQTIFQDPYSSLNPRRRIGDAIMDGMRIHRLYGGPHAVHEMEELLKRVGLEPRYANRFPHQFSGGQRQRIAIARALAVRPRFIVADEAVSALDVSVKHQILELLLDLQREQNLTYLFITHDLGIVRHFADRIAVMRGGELVEEGCAEEVMGDPQHSYTKQLLAAVPRLDPDKRRFRPIIKSGQESAVVVA